MISLELKNEEWFEVLEALALYKYAIATGKSNNEEQLERITNIQECIKVQII